jgi:hypothetical protein
MVIVPSTSTTSVDRRLLKADRTATPAATEVTLIAMIVRPPTCQPSPTPYPQPFQDEPEKLDRPDNDRNRQRPPASERETQGADHTRRDTTTGPH